MRETVRQWNAYTLANFIFADAESCCVLCLPHNFIHLTTAFFPLQCPTLVVTACYCKACLANLNRVESSMWGHASGCSSVAVHFASAYRKNDLPTAMVVGQREEREAVKGEGTEKLLYSQQRDRCLLNYVPKWAIMQFNKWKRRTDDNKISAFLETIKIFGHRYKGLLSVKNHFPAKNIHPIDFTSKTLACAIYFKM